MLIICLFMGLDLTGRQEVTGSNPVFSTYIIKGFSDAALFLFPAL
jgi:hypothetical protein